MMLVKTKHFGEIDLDENKVIHFEDGIFGFEAYKNFTLLYDDEDGERPDISWLQSLEEPALAIPVISPFLIKQDYNPVVEDELLAPLGKLTNENIIILVSVTVPADITKMSANIKAPFIINGDTRMAGQIIVENQEYEVKHYFYDELKAIKEKRGKHLC